MKTAVVLFRGKEGIALPDYINLLLENMDSAGFAVSTLEVLDGKDDLGFVRRLREFKDTADNLIIIDGEDVSFDLKKIIADEFDTAVVENENARTFLDAVSKANGVDYDEKYAELPMSATLIPNVSGAMQGYMIDDSELTLAVLPSNYDECSVMCFKYVVPYLENKHGIRNKKIILKYMGARDKLYNVLNGAREQTQLSFNANVSEKYGDYKISLYFNENEIAHSGEVVRYIVGELKDDIYAEFDTTPAKRLFDIIKLKNLKLCTAESFTAGSVASTFIENPGASAFFDEGIISYSNESKMERLGVGRADLIREGAVSSTVAYQMCAGLLKKGNCDVAISTTGIAGPKSDDTNKPVGLCYISVGLRTGVHTYKFNFSGTREEITKTATNTAQFLAIKIIKRI